MNNNFVDFVLVTMVIATFLSVVGLHARLDKLERPSRHTLDRKESK